jgi:hypothetical protein
LRDYIHEDHAEQPRSLWRHSRDRAVHDWATGLVGPAVGPRGSVTFAEAGAAATVVLDFIKSVDPFRPAQTRHVVVSWLANLERRAAPGRGKVALRALRAEQAGRAAPDPAIWAKAAMGDDWR